MIKSLLSRLDHARFVGALTVVLLIFLVFSTLTSQHLKQRALESWENQAYRDAQSITGEGLAWLSVFQSNLRSLATLFHVKDDLDEDSFLDALSLIEETDVATPVVSWGLAKIRQPQQEGDTFSFPIVMSTEAEGKLSKGMGLDQHQAFEETALKAMYSPGRVVTGNTYSDLHNNQHVMFAITVPCHDCGTAILFSSLNMDDFFKDLQTLYIPKGLSLHLGELMDGIYQQGKGTVLIGPYGRLDPTDRTAQFSTESGGARWRFTWRIDEDYRGGPSLGLARLVQWGGIALGVSLFTLFIHMSRENIRANKLATRRTQELRKALLETEHVHSRLLEISRIDSLTQIPNRRFLEEFIDREWVTAQRSGASMAVAIIDIDHFKAYNKALGNAAGDACLQTIASILHDAIKRPTDTLARYGSDKFICILPKTALEGAKTICLRLSQTIASAKIPHPSSSVSDNVTISIGAVTCTATRDITAEDIINCANDVLHSAKLRGRNQYAIENYSARPHGLNENPN